MKKINKYLIILIIISFGCKNENKKLSINKYKNGNIFGKGYVNNKNQKIGKWDYFKKSGEIDYTIEYYIINDKQYTNQGWYYNGSKSDTIKEFGNFYNFKELKKNYSLKDTMWINIDYKPMLSLNSNLILCTSSDINKNFSNIDYVKLDTIVGTSTNIRFYITHSKKEKKHLRGFLLEYYNREPTYQDSIIHQDRKLYFDKEYFVN